MHLYKNAFIIKGLKYIVKYSLESITKSDEYKPIKVLTILITLIEYCDYLYEKKNTQCLS